MLSPKPESHMNETPEDLGSPAMFDMFRAEAEAQTTILSSGLLELERGTVSSQIFDVLMRAAHSLKGAARIVNLESVARIAHVLEDYFVAAQRRTQPPERTEIDLLLTGVDLLAQPAKRNEMDVAVWARKHADEMTDLLRQMRELLPAVDKDFSAEAEKPRATALLPRPRKPRLGRSPAGNALVKNSARLLEHHERRAESAERILRLAPENLNRLLGLAGESLVESRWLRPFSESLQQLKAHHIDLSSQLENLRLALNRDSLGERSRACCAEGLRQLASCRTLLAEKVQELDLFDRRSSHLSQRLYLEVLRMRMRPFSDGVRRFPRMIRDLARTLDKQVKLEIYGETTQVDRDILERLETPLAHLLRNAVDHGCEPAEQRQLAGKAPECTVGIEARHSAGMLLVTVTDDGVGVDLERLRGALVKNELATPALAAKFTDSELLEFLFLPGFTLKEQVSEVSGRGFGLDVVQNMVKSVRGAIRISNQPGRGLRVQLQLPLTLSVVRALLVEVAGEPYAVPLGQVIRTLTLPRANLQTLQSRHYLQLGNQQIGMLTARQVLGSDLTPPEGDLPVVILGERATRCGLIVDRFLGERELVVQQLDPHLGKVKNISAAALMEDGSPVLIIDVDELARSIEELLAAGRLGTPRRDALAPAKRPKRVLAVDDSPTVREMERQLLASKGYQTDVAADGVEAWNAVRSGIYDLVITDLDMPRMDGMELTARIKKDAHLASVPVLIISYKDRPEDRIRGLQAGADYYLTKGTFQDQDLVEAVVNLIGKPG